MNRTNDRIKELTGKEMIHIKKRTNTSKGSQYLTLEETQGQHLTYPSGESLCPAWLRAEKAVCREHTTPLAKSPATEPGCEPIGLNRFLEKPS